MEIVEDNTTKKNYNISPDEVWQKCLTAYTNRDFNFLDENWRFLSSEKRLKIMYMSYKAGITHFTSKEHFDLHKNDFEIIEDAKNKYYEYFEVPEEVIEKMETGFYAPKSVVSDEGIYRDSMMEEVFKNLALYDRLKEYDDLTKYNKHFSKEIIEQNYNILRCSSKRTASRISFMADIYQDEMPNSRVVSECLRLTNWKFNYRFQAEIDKIMGQLEADKDKYKALASLVNEVPDYAYDKFVELALRAYYGEEKLNASIDRKVREIEGTPVVQQGEKDLETEIEVKELFSALPVGLGTEHFSDPENVDHNYSKREKLDQGKIKLYLKELRKKGIMCEGYITSKSGLKAIGEDKVIYFVLRSGNYIILEPIGQVGNASFVMRNEGKVEDLEHILKVNDKDELVESGLATRINHKRTQNLSYDYSVYAILNMVKIIEEFSKEEPRKRTISSLRKEIVEIIPQDEITEATGYILNTSGLIRLAEFVDENEVASTGRKSAFVYGKKKSTKKGSEEIENS